MKIQLYSQQKLLFVFLIILSLFQSYNNQPTPSDNCLNYNENNSVCQQCVPGFYLQYYLCFPCNPGCLCSSKNDFCQSCMQLQIINNLNFSSYLDQNLNQCILCNSVINNCLECQNQFKCTKCFNGSYLIQEKNINGSGFQRYCSMNVCQNNCQICMDSQLCEQCQDGYFKYDNKTCSENQCQQNCQLCSSVTQCQICEEGYYLDPQNTTASCQPCMANCQACFNQNTCDICSPSYNYVSGSCSSNGLSNCVSYAEQFSVCLSCQPGYQVTAGSCNQCSGCDLCTEQFICITPCQQGNYPFNFACLTIFQQNIKILISLLILYTFLIF